MDSVRRGHGVCGRYKREGLAFVGSVMRGTGVCVKCNGRSWRLWAV